MNILRRLIKWVLAAFAGVIILALAVCVAFFCWQKYVLIPRYPDEARLRSVFKAKRPLFDQIRKMASDELSQSFHIGKYDWQCFGLPIERTHEYQRLLSSLQSGTTLVVSNPDFIGNRTASFIFQNGGTLLVIGPQWANGITFLPANIERYGKVVKSSDEIDLKEDDEYLIPIVPQWYIFHEQN